MPLSDEHFVDLDRLPAIADASFLLVSDEAAETGALVHLLQRAWPQGPAALVATDSRAASTIIEQRRVVLVFCQLSAACRDSQHRLLETLECVHPLPLVAVSDVPDAALASTAIGLGAQDVVSLEELDSEDVRRIVRHAIERQALQTRLEENLHELEKTRTQFQSLIIDNADALVIVDQALIVRYANPAAERLLGEPLSELVGSHFEFPLDTGTAVEVCLDRPYGQKVVLSIRYMETLWNGARAYIATLRDITERKTVEEALALAKQRAEEVSSMKSLFLANMSHELRTPLNSILGFSELMSLEIHGELGNERYRGYIDSISTAGQYLLELINDLLDLSKVEAGQFELLEEVFDLTALVRDVADVLGPRVDKAELRIVQMLPERQVRIQGDMRKTKQVLLNLLSNAVKFTPSGGEIRLGYRLGPDGELTLFVSDDGIGIPAEQIPKALSAFGQVDNPFTRRRGEGTGLGLTLSKRIAELHGGTLRIRSAVAEGTEVLVTFPSERVVLRGPLRALGSAMMGRA